MLLSPDILSPKTVHLIVMLMILNCTLYTSFGVHDCKNAVAAMKEDLLRFRDWCFDNRLLINPDETKLIIYGSRKMTERLPQFHLSLLGKELVPTQSV